MASRSEYATYATLPDVQEFLKQVAKSSLFCSDAPIFVSRAPGRLDVMGGIADYSGSLVLQLPIREATLVAVQRTSEPLLRIVSFGGDSNGRSAEFLMPMRELPEGYAEARAMFARDPRCAWAAYVAGTLMVLKREKGVHLPGGVQILIESNVPEGKGVSSSAAIEVAVMQAVASAFDIDLEGRELALLCQMVENRVVGAPCGIMDQMASAVGHENHLLALLCQPAEVRGNLPVPDDIAFWGIDSGVRHSIGGADYGSVRVGAFMGYRILAERAGHAIERRGDTLRVHDPEWQGFLANVTPSRFEAQYAPHLPERITGAEFLAQYGGTTDRVTRVNPDRTYAVRVPTAHPVYEHFRVRTFAVLLGGATVAGAEEGAEEGAELRGELLVLLGELMYQSHASYSACGLGSEATDLLVSLIRAAGPERGLYGAKITGGGSGGTVAILAKRGADAAVRQIAQEYASATGRNPHLFTSSSPGARAFGTLSYQREELF